ncbi:hypothetical protein K490DRAFT_63788 [Saccharata proteae CBS 121410]|uniref:Uncharacterized protein n=1 Tax=Saccharata proteae CBS 121410 TaxID=1314787 RepID=A0A6A5YCN4_9PEZI|nr:hypothetical protein K490DRAFT_63788 [Saccharata proteae CBS 121410]
MLIALTFLVSGLSLSGFGAGNVLLPRDADVDVQDFYDSQDHAHEAVEVAQDNVAPLSSSLPELDLRAAVLWTTSFSGADYGSDSTTDSASTTATAITSQSLTSTPSNSSSAAATFSPALLDGIDVWGDTVTDYSGTIEPTGTGQLYASKCAALSRSWSIASSVFCTENEVLSTATYDVTSGVDTETLLMQGADSTHLYSSAETSTTYRRAYTSPLDILTYTTANYTTLCDGFPRISNRDEQYPVTSTIMGTYDWTGTANKVIHTNTQFTGNFSESHPSPTCSVKPDDCKVFRSAWTSASSSRSSAVSASSMYTVSLASPPTSLVLNDRSETSTIQLTTTSGSAPTLTLLGSTIFPSSGSEYIFQSLGEDLATLTPGGKASIYTDSVIDGPYCATTSTVSEGQVPDGANTNSCYGCTIGGGNVRLMYFPVPTTVSRDMCALYPSATTNNFTAPAYTHGPSYAVVNGSTFYANKAYISYEMATAHQYCYQHSPAGYTLRVGSSYPGAILEVDSTAVSSFCHQSKAAYYGVRGGQEFPFNFADLNAPVPASAYQCMSTCGAAWDNPVGMCTTIIEDEFRPQVVVPPEIRSLDPAWAQCILALEGAYDPPIPLTATDLLVPSDASWKDQSSTAASSASPAHVSPSTTASSTGATVALTTSATASSTALSLPSSTTTPTPSTTPSSSASETTIWTIQTTTIIISAPHTHTRTTSPTANPIASLGMEVLVPADGSGSTLVVINGTTLWVSGPALTTNRQIISLGTAGLAIGNSTTIAIGNPVTSAVESVAIVTTTSDITTTTIEPPQQSAGTASSSEVWNIATATFPEPVSSTMVALGSTSSSGRSGAVQVDGVKEAWWAYTLVGVAVFMFFL